MSLCFDRIEVRLAGPLTVAGGFVMRLLIIGGGAVITWDGGGRLADLAWEIRVAIAAALMGKGAISDDDLLAVRVVGYVDHFQQQIAEIRAGRRYDFDLPWASDFALEGRAALAAGAVGRAVSG
jgi:hypothetical protein